MSRDLAIDAVELIDVRLMKDGHRLKVCLRGQDGVVHDLALPARWLNDLLNVVPQLINGGEAHRLAGWTMAPTAGGEILLTLRTPEGQAINFTIKPWQAQAMATLATYGHFGRDERGSLH